MQNPDGTFIYVYLFVECIVHRIPSPNFGTIKEKRDGIGIEKRRKMEKEVGGEGTTEEGS